MQILTKNNCPENVIVAGVLHDTLEGTDTKTNTCQERKQATIDALRNESAAVQMIACAGLL